MIGLNIRERSSRIYPVSDASAIWMVCRMALHALSLTAGVKLTKYFPYRFFDRRGRNVYPRKSNFISGYSPRRSSSLQYTIRVFSGCSSSPHSSNRSPAAQAVLRFCFCSAVHHSIIGIPRPRISRSVPLHPLIKRVMQKQIRQQRTNDSTLRCARFPLYYSSIFRLKRSL